MEMFMFLSRGPQVFLESRRQFFNTNPGATTVALMRWFVARKILKLRGFHENVRSMGARGVVMDMPMYSFVQCSDLYNACSLFDVPDVNGGQDFPLCIPRNMVAVRKLWSRIAEKMFHFDKLRKEVEHSPWLPLPNTTALRKLWMWKIERRWKKHLNGKWDEYGARWEFDRALIDRGKHVPVEDSDSDDFNMLSNGSQNSMRQNRAPKNKLIRTRFRRGVGGDQESNDEEMSETAPAKSAKREGRQAEVRARKRRRLQS